MPSPKRSSFTMKRFIIPFIILAFIITGIDYYLYQSPSIEAPETTPKVIVKTLKREKVRIWSEFSGRAMFL